MDKTNFQRYAHYCEALETCDLYVEYTFYNLIASCLQRRVWMGYPEWKIFPNLYLVFVGDPGTGKTVAARVNINMFQKFRAIDDGGGFKKGDQIIPTAPDNISVEALIRKMAFGIKSFKDYNGQTHAQSSVSFISEEMANLFKQGRDENLVRFFLQGYDCGDYTKELKGAEEQNRVEYIHAMCINLLGATTPEHMNGYMNSGFLNDGFLGRALFIAGGRPKNKKTLFIPNIDQITDMQYLEQYCRNLATVAGQCEFSPEAFAFLDNWYLNDNVILNDDRKLAHYYSRKKMSTIKLAIVHHFSETYKTFIIGIDSVKWALAALARAEKTMHIALSSVGKNPIHALAEIIARFLNDRRRQYPNNPLAYRKSIQDLCMIFGSEGTAEQVGTALQQLLYSKKVKPVAVGATLMYEGLLED